MVLVFNYSCDSSDGDVNYKTLKDIDNNEYRTVKIGTQTWMAENLATTRYRNGDNIEYYSNGVNKVGKYYPFKYYPYKYGNQYNWYALNDLRGLAPKGWHVATDKDWVTLVNYLIKNGYNYDGTTTENKIAKALAAEYGWPNNGPDYQIGSIARDLTLNNKSGFSGLPNGTREIASWWSATETDEFNSTVRYLYYEFLDLGTESKEKFEFNCVRCVKD
jgi:uncharacterized protein (TIGR02145 family)